MKVMKKIAALLLALCLAVPMSDLVAEAAEGSLTFSDPSTKVGENVTVDLAIEAGGAAIGDADVTMSYDTSALEFISGTGVQADGAGKLTYSGSGTGSETELRTTLEFRALQAGPAEITVDSYTAYLYSDETLNLAEGYSNIVIEAADDGSTTAEPSGSGGTVTSAVTDIKVTVDGVEYSFSEAFTKTDIPDGYSEKTLTFNGGERKFVTSEGGVTLGFLVDASGLGSFFLYDEETASFSPYVEIPISDSTSLILLNEPDAVKLPEAYAQKELEVLNQTFPTWNNAAEDPRFYILYALNTRTGEKGLYQYDMEDETYQTFTAPEVTEEVTDDSLLGKVKDFVANHILLAMIAGAVVVLFLLILVIVLGVKVIHRNQELDDLYEEYDIPVDDEPAASPKVQAKSRKQFVGYDEEDEDYDDDYDEDYDEEYEDDDYDDDYSDDDGDYDEDYDDSYEDDYEEDVRPAGRKKDKKAAKGKKAASKEKDYDIDFIDL